MNHRSVHPTFRLPDDQASSGRAKAVAATAAGLLLGGLTVFGVAISASAPTLPPLINLATEPLYMNGAKTKANLTLSLSVEFPTVGQTYRDEFDQAKTYIGYFDPKVCYRHVPGGGNTGPYFDWSGKATNDGACNGGGFNGNFMNWATSSAIDIMRYGLTGGNRTVDNSSGNGTTIVQRAWLPDDFYRSNAYFSQKHISNAMAAKMIEQNAYNALKGKDLYIYNCRDRVYFATEADSTGGCTNPFGVAGAKSNKLVGPSANTDGGIYYNVSNMVCDPNSATNRLMTYNANTKRWRGLCMKYPNGNYKPVGQFQVNADNLRVSVFGYLIDSTVTRYGGVLRAPMKYLGPRQFDKNFNLLPTANPDAEWDKTTGVFLGNPQSGNASYGDQGYGQSGAINYINKFGTLAGTTYANNNSNTRYKGFDPLSELYYESIRYLQGKQPTPQAVSGMTDTNKERFPAYGTWVDPFAGFEDSTGDANTCLRNSILTIADTFTHRDKSVPGNTITTDGDFIRAAESSPTLDVQFWSDVVGSFESDGGKSYTDSKGRTQSASNLASNTKYPALANAGTLNTGSTNGSFHIAGLAYWANTQSFRTDLPKGRITTYGIDVNENRASDDVNFRRQRQIYLAAKYGGFDDKLAGNTGNPFAKGNNLLWQDVADGDAKNYFLVSDAQKFLDSIADVFAKVVEETGSIAGGAVSTQRLQAGTSGGVFQARFNPVANYWSGRLLRYQLSLASDGQTVTLSDTPTWEAAEVLTNRVSTSTGLNNRNVVIGSPRDKQGVNLPSPFKWTDLAQPFKDAFSTTVDATGATVLDTALGQKRVDYLRGDRSNEISDTNPTGLFRPRDYVLGDIVNSALVYVGKPKSLAEAGYSSFQSTNNSRPATVYVNANDGMLHAFKEADGSELFAYVPGFLGDKLTPLTDQLYTHAAFADATPAVAEAKVGADWKTVLVSGVGGGAQGVYALDVTDPTSFDKNKVLWEFTDSDSPALGNVIGAPQIVKIRDTSGASPTYKWYAVFGSGVNNYAADGKASTTGYPSIFILDLSFVPTATSKWVEGSNFWRIELPQSSTAVAMGMVGVHAEVRPSTNALDYIYAGDLQGNVWVLNFNKDMDASTAGVQPWSMSNMTANATTNANLVAELTDTGGKLVPLFVAKRTSGSVDSLQPITTVPKVVRGLDGNLLVTVGTGKFLETDDLTVPMPTTASMYTLLHIVDSPKQITGISQLQAGTLSSAADGTAVVSIPSFVYGYPPNSASTLKMGWYFNYDASVGERQVTEIVSDGKGRLLFSSIYPTKGACGEGGGRYCELNVLTGNASCQESRVGIMAAPLVVIVGLVTSDANAQGGRWTQERYVVITQGSKGMEIATPPGGGGAVRTSPARRDGSLSWRQIHNYQELKQQNAAP